MRSSCLALAMVLLADPVRAQDRAVQAPEPDPGSMIHFEAGPFTMGQYFETPGPYGDSWYIDQVPAREVTLGEFWMDPHEVTVAQFALFLTYAAGEYHFHPDQSIERVRDGYLPLAGREDEPITHVTWEAAHHYCLWAGKVLPTEAQWERAAAGTERREYPWGDEGPSCMRAAYFTGSSYCELRAVAVGSHPEGATPEGVHDMAGNVAEWVADFYDFYPEGDQTDPTGPAEGTYRVVRGGGYLEQGQMLRTRARRGADPALRSSNIGFRCAYTTSPADGALRGSLEPPADVDREPTDRPLAPAVREPDVLYGGMVQPVALVPWLDALYVLDRVQVKVFEVMEGVDVGQVPVEGLTSPRDMATDGNDLFITDDGTGDVLRVTAEFNVSPIATGQNAPLHVVADGGQVFWSTDDGIMSCTDAGGVTLLADVVGVTDMALSASHLYLASSGGAVTTDSMTGRVPREGGALEVINGYGADFYPTSLAWEPDSRRLFILHRKRSWPADGHLSQWAEGMSYPVTFAYTPPSPGRMIHRDGFLYWTTSQTLVRMQVGVASTYEVVVPWTRGADMVGTGATLTWVDSQDGRLCSLDVF